MYLTFFPGMANVLRALESPDPRAVESMGVVRGKLVSVLGRLRWRQVTTGVGSGSAAAGPELSRRRR